MPNIIDYIRWRGDVPFDTSPFNEVDALILSQLSYMDMGGIVPEDFCAPMMLSAVASAFKAADDYDRRCDMGALINELSVQLLDEAGSSARFGNMGVCGYRYTLDEERGEQFCAVTFLYSESAAGMPHGACGSSNDVSPASSLRLLPSCVAREAISRNDGGGSLKNRFGSYLAARLLPHKAVQKTDAVKDDGGRAFVSYRGTDDTIVGWKEDFNMAVLDTVPSQLSAAAYLSEAMEALPHKRFCTGGHSKGGNLAVHAAAMLEGKTAQRLNFVYNMDGPGFPDSRLDTPQFKAIIPRIKSFYPQFSIIGMIFSHAGDAAIVESDASLLMQHDPFSWKVEARSFVTASSFDRGSEAFHKTVNAWLSSVSEADRAAFVETLFKVIEATGARTNSELESSWFTSAPRAIKALAGIKAETREQVMRMIQALFPAVKNGILRTR